MKLLHIESPFARALVEYFRELETRLDLRQPIKAWVAGGMAVNMYTGQRITGDIDAEFSARIIASTRSSNRGHAFGWAEIPSLVQLQL